MRLNAMIRRRNVSIKVEYGPWANERLRAIVPAHASIGISEVMSIGDGNGCLACIWGRMIRMRLKCAISRRRNVSIKVGYGQWANEKFRVIYPAHASVGISKVMFIGDGNGCLACLWGKGSMVPMIIGIASRKQARQHVISVRDVTRVFLT